MRISKNEKMPKWLSKVAEDLESQIIPDQDEKRDRGTYSIGECPPEVIRAAVEEQCPNGYPMVIKDQKVWDVIVNAVNKGIDPSLEAFTMSAFDEKTGKCNIAPSELHILLRRLFEAEDEESWGLRSDILSTLGIEEI